MSGFRLFWTLSMTICACALHWEQAHAMNDAVPPMTPQDRVGQSPPASLPLFAAAADVKRENIKKGSADKASGKSPAKRKQRAPLLPASAELPQSGIASWVGKYFQGRHVALWGERHVMESFTAAHRAIAFNTILRVTDLNTGRSVLVRVNDRGPYIRGRIIDLARGAAEYLGYVEKGLATVRLEYVGNAKEPDLRYYIRMRPSKGAAGVGLVRGFGPFAKFDEAASLFMILYKSSPEAELMAVRETRRAEPANRQ